MGRKIVAIPSLAKFCAIKSLLSLSGRPQVGPIWNSAPLEKKKGESGGFAFESASEKVEDYKSSLERETHTHKRSRSSIGVV